MVWVQHTKSQHNTPVLFAGPKSHSQAHSWQGQDINKLCFDVAALDDLLPTRYNAVATFKESSLSHRVASPPPYFIQCSAGLCHMAFALDNEQDVIRNYTAANRRFDHSINPPTHSVAGPVVLERTPKCLAHTTHTLLNPN